ncbi:MAG: Peptidase E [uncultured Thermomicrobiales bacterium]|uniref:Peptidase E n=1 Tax=uncultured Thermomicrobiales bacterium TaxID=1645740 RepID=A0A6J4VRW2_9BACT|nr:MAG: Peptidase E [uncultured Thermomicrobiales bacterium]
MPERQILAIGGGGVSQEPQNTLLLDYLIGLTGKAKPRVCIIGTATGDRENNLVTAYRAFGRRGCPVTHLGLFTREVEDLRAFIFDQDLIYVGGGNTASMLAVWRVHGLDAILREAWEAGIVLGGVSAGAICWFEAGITDSFGPTLQALDDGLRFLPGSCCPHYDGEEQRRPTYQGQIAAGLSAGIALDDGCAAHYRGTEIAEIVTSRPEARAYRLARDGATGAAIEMPLEARFLG